MLKKTLVLIRHAHRENSIRSKDNGLSEKGREQARWLKKYFLERFEMKSGIWLVSSPKTRCVETLNPIAAQTNLEVDINPDLDEQSAGETSDKFESRVHGFLHEWTLMPQALTVVCSHGDWLPVATQELLHCQCDFKKGAWLEVEWSGEATMKSYIPTFRPFYG